RLCAWSKATPLATSGWLPSVLAALREVGVTVMVPGGRDRTSRPTLATPLGVVTSFAMGWIRNTSVTVVPSGDILHTRPCPVVPSPVQRLPFQSKARPLVPGTLEANTVAVGGDEALGVKR